MQAGGTPAARLLLVCAAVAAVLAAPAAGARASSQRLASPSTARIGEASGLIRDAILTKPAFLRLLQPGTYWGGVFKAASTGEGVTIYVSNSYPQDTVTGQRWADFFGSLVHGSELSRLTVYLAPDAEIGSICGVEALGCYSPDQSLLIAPGTAPSEDISAEAVVTHEYGHHVAAHRSNAPWVAVDTGTKRWASYEQVCVGARSGKFFPGSEMLPTYRLNPGEGFAETYRVLNERLAGLAEAPWDVVSQLLYPTDAALSLVQQDVTSPWQGSTLVTRTGSVSKRARVRTFTVATPLDGTLRLSLRGPAKARFALDVLTPSTARLAHATGTKTAATTATICGQRSLTVRVSRLAGAGAFRLSLTRP